jgi:hypothetical protein
MMPTLVEHAIAEQMETAAPVRADGWLNPARGIAIGIAIGLLVWTAIGAAAWLFMG